MNKNLQRKILEIFKKPKIHPSIEDIYKLITEKNKKIKRQEVVTELDNLEKTGELKGLQNLNEVKHYHARQDFHYHFICDVCGQVKDVKLEKGAINMLKEYTQTKCHSFAKITRINLSFQGICHFCNEKRK